MRGDGVTRVLLAVVALLLAANVAEPWLARAFLAPPEPRLVAARGDLAQSEQAAIELFQRVSPSVVQVVGIEDDPSALAGGGRPTASGTGFVWDAQGHVVTNNHVVEGAPAVAVRFASGEVVRAEILGLAPSYDLAVLRLEGATGVPVPVAVGRSADLRVGQAAFAIGNPFGLDQSLTTGVISALKRRLPTAGGREITDVVQTDAAVNPGNSGGPLIDSAGRVIGVNTAIYSPSGANAGIGFAIPIDVVNRVVPELIRNGRVPVPGIGIVAAEEELAARLGLQGVIVLDTAPDSPAARAGLRGADLTAGRLGDVIVGVNGKPVRRFADLTDELERVGVGAQVTLDILRGRDTLQVGSDVTDVSRI